MTPQPTCHIVPASMEHAVDIASLSLELGYQTTVDETREALTQLLASVRHLAIVACDAEGRMLGWTTAERRWTLESGETAELTGLVVTRAVRRSGVGRCLVAAAEQWAQQQGFSSIRVRSNVSRTESHPFYERLGFRLAKTQHVYMKTLRFDG